MSRKPKKRRQRRREDGQGQRSTEFQSAVEAAPDPVNGAFRSGIQALGANSKYIVCQDTRRLTGSVFLDQALQSDLKHAEQPRWDYGLGYKSEDGKEQTVWVEMHRPTVDEVQSVIKKKEWLERWLSTDGKRLRELTDRTVSNLRFVWIAAGRSAVPANTPQNKLLSSNGIHGITRQLKLP